MRIGKRLLSLLCTAALLLSLVGGAFAAETDYTLTKEDCTYTVDPDSKAVTITGIRESAYGTTRRNIIVPDTLDGNPVTVFGGGSKVFAGNGWFLTKVTLPEGLTAIAKDGFDGCSDMTTVILPSTLKTIGDEAFDGCFDLVDAAFPQGLTSIGKYAFRHTALTGTLTLPDSVTTLANGAFTDTDFTSIGSLGGVTELPDYLFNECNLLTEINLPDTITKLGVGTFYACAGLKKVTLPESITEIPSHAFCFRVPNSSPFSSSLTEVNLPDTITSIGEYAFEGNAMLERITLPAGLTMLGNSAFSGCRALTSIDIPDGVMTIGTNTFSNCWALQSVKLPANLTEVNHFAFEQCRALQSLTFPSGLKTLGHTAFTYTPALRQVIFQGPAPDTGVSNPFSTTRDQLLTVYVPAGTEAGYQSWGRWTSGNPVLNVGGTPPEITPEDTAISLSAVLEVSPQDKLILWCTVDVTPKGHPSDPALAPSGTISFTLNSAGVAPPVHFVGGITSTHQTVGYEVDSYIGQEITIQAHLAPSIGFNGSDSNSLTGAVIRPTDGQEHPFLPNGSSSDKVYDITSDGASGVIITKINGEMATRPTPVIPDKIDGKPVTGLGDGLFANNNFTAYVTIPSSVKSLGTGVFQNCLYLVVVSLPDSITEIPADTFSGCSSRLQSVTLPKTIAAIGANAFKGCAALTEMTLPASLVTMDPSAFSGCALTRVTFEGNAPALTGYVSREIFDHWTILTTENGKTGFDVSPWKEMRREPVVLGISFDPAAVTFTDQTDDGFTMLMPVTFDTSAYGAGAPTPDLSKVEVYIYNFVMQNVTVVGDKLSVPVDKKYYGAPRFTRVSYPGDWTYQAAECKNVDVNMPTPKLASAITAVTHTVETAPDGSIKLWITPTVTPTDYYGQGYTPSLLKMEVKLGETVCERIGVDNGRLFAVVPDTVAGTTQPLTVTFTGDERFLASAPFIAPENVIVPGQAPITTLTATAGKVNWDGTNYLLPLATTLSVRHAGANPQPSRNLLTVTLKGEPAQCTDDGTTLSMVVPKALLGTSPAVVISYPGETVGGYSYPAKDFTLPSVTLTDPAVETTLTATAGTLTQNNEQTAYYLPLTVALAPVQTVEGAVPNLGSIKITLGGAGGTAAEDANYTIDANDILNVVIPNKYFFTTTSITVTYPGEPLFKSAAQTLRVKIPDPDPQPVDTTLVATVYDFAWNMAPGWGHCLVLDVEVGHPPYHSDEAPPLNLELITVALEEVEVDSANLHWSGGRLYIPVGEALYGQKISVTLNYPGEDGYFNPSEQTLTDVLIVDPSTLLVSTTLTASAGTLTKDSDDSYYLPLTVELTANGETDKTPNREDIEVSLNGAVVVCADGGENVLKLPISSPLFSSLNNIIALQYKGDQFFMSSSKILKDVAIPNPVPAKTTLDFVVDKLLTSLTDSRRVLRLTVTLANDSYWADSTLKPSLGDVTVMLGSTSAEIISVSEKIVDVYVPSELMNTTSDVTVAYPGNEYFEASTKTVTGVNLSDPAPKPALTGIAVTKQPTKTAYTVGEALDTTGMVVTAAYNDGSSKVLTSADYTISPDGAFTEAKTVTITVTHEGKSASFTVSVASKPVTPPDPPSGGGGSAPAPKPSTDENAKVTVSNKDVTEAVKAAAESGSVVLKADTAENAKSVAVTVPASMMKAIAKAEAPVSIQSPVADLTLDTKVLEALQAGGAKNVVVSAGAADTAALPKAAQTTLEGRPVYDITISAGGKSVSQFNGGTVTVALPYTPAAGERSDSLAAYWVKEDGSMEVLRNSVYKDGKLTFSTPHLSTYAILHHEVSFLDVSSDLWFKNDIDFTVARGILNGMGDDGMGGELFGPAVTLTGTMAVVALARMDGVADGTGEGWAAPAMAWAKEKNILPEGFSADSPLTREQFAYLAAGYLGGAKAATTPAYLDRTQITSSCLESVNYLTSISVMHGTGDGYFSPKLSLSRSELAAVLHRLVVLQLG